MDLKLNCSVNYLEQANYSNYRFCVAIWIERSIVVSLFDFKYISKNRRMCGISGTICSLFSAKLKLSFSVFVFAYTYVYVKSIYFFFFG